MKYSKRALRENVGVNGQLDGDRFMRALIVLRNTPGQDTGLSPAQMLLGRPLRCMMPYCRFEQITQRGSQVSGRWHNMWDEREVALRHRLGKMALLKSQ